MKTGWQAILDSIAASLRTDSVLITLPLVLLVIFAVAIALYLVINLLVNQARLDLSATVSLGNQMEQPGGLPADGSLYAEGSLWNPRGLDQIHCERRADGRADEGRPSTEGADSPGDRKRYGFSLPRDQSRVRKLGIA
jgi:hypothetical protein